MKVILGSLVGILIASSHSNAQDLNIIEVRRNIPLSDDEKIYKDFYINGGTDAGLKANMVVSVQRKVAIKDASGTQSYGEVHIPVGQLKIIYVSNKVAVAREHKMESREQNPWLEQLGFMNGDRIELK